MKKHISTIILILVFFVGLSLLLYPTFSDYWNSLHQTQAIADYVEAAAEMDDDTYERIWKNAQEYNAALIKNGNTWRLSTKQRKEYEAQLDVGGTGIMGYIEIPTINCTLPIYHGTDEGVLQIGVGHLEGTSLPVGGESTHSAISGHRGLPSAKLFTDLDQMKEGDKFFIRVLDETLAYEVDQIRIVKPTEVDQLEIVEGKDYCTLITCTPYGINSHRLLVRGHRIQNTDLPIQVTADALQVEPTIVAPIVAVPILLLLIVWVFVSTGKRKGDGTADSFEERKEYN